MNPIDKNLPHDEGDRFDRLVDGELSEAERRDLLASMDDEPEGWRKCALAFLEAQTWSESFGELTRGKFKSSALPTSPKSSISVPLAAPRLHKTKKPLGAMGTVLAMSACFLLALGLGSWMFRSPSSNSSLSPPTPMIVGTSNKSPMVPILPFPDAGTPNANPSSKPSSSTPWQMVQLRAPGLTGNDKPLQLPAIQRDSLDANFLQNVPNPLPDEVLQALKQSGHTVRLHREFVPVPLKDGRRLVLPIDQIEVEAIDDQAY